MLKKPRGMTPALTQTCMVPQVTGMELVQMYTRVWSGITEKEQLLTEVGWN